MKPYVSKSTLPSAPGNETPAGEFSEWLLGFQSSLRNGTDNQVACGDCVGCCSSSYFIHMGPDETDALRHLPKDLAIPAPGMAPGNLLIGYQPDGRCPLLGADHRCNIYSHRPKTCRAYDCRIFAAAGITAGGNDKSTINERVKNWKFEYASETSRRAHRSVKQTAKFIREHAKLFPGGRIPTDPSQLAILAIKAHSIFLESPDQARTDADLAFRIVESSRRDA
jgi:Fe-S-cluster containining protein